jgi:hypothetical protein
MAKTDPPLERVRKLALQFGDVTEGTTFGNAAFKVKDKTFAWFPQRAEVEDGSLGVRMSFVERDLRIAANPDVFYFTPHYQNYPSVLARIWLLTDRDLRELLASAHEFMLAKRRSAKKRR